MNKSEKNKPIGILDSGVGGLTAVVPVQKLLPNESIIYLGDSLRMPYGNKHPDEITELAGSLIDFLEKQGVKAILLACNTISAHIEKLKSSVRLISIIDAGAAAAAETVKEPAAGLIATYATVQSGMYEKKISQKCPSLEIISNSSASLPKIIDSQLENLDLLNENIREIIDPILLSSSEIKSLILGCSHFPIIKNEINDLYPQINLIDPAEKQAEILKKYLTENDLLSDKEPTLTLYTTAETYEFAAAVKRLHLDIDALIKVSL